MVQAVATKPDTLDTSKLKFIDVDGIRTRYYEDGRGEPLILLYGGAFGEGGLETWSRNLPGLAEKFHVFALDKLGQGHTDNPKRDEDYTFDALLQHTIAWINAVGIDKAHVLGHSRGALLAAALVYAMPGLARTVVFGNSNTLAPNDERWPAFVFYSEVQKLVPPGPPSKDSIRLFIDKNSYSSDHVSDEYLEAMLAIQQMPKTKEAKAKMADIRGTGNGKVVGRSTFLPSMARVKAETLAKIDEEGLPAPTLVFWGFNDPSAKLPLGHLLFERICAKTPEAEMHIFNHAGHSTYREHPEEVNQLLEAFCLRDRS
jgi:2-hydroxy-6-oxo-6-(2'-carboxyphenyl)-hexa-2,4-dienoate hydrolase